MIHIIINMNTKHFTDYIKNLKTIDINKKITTEIKKNKTLTNVIFYGKNGTGKYTKCLQLINNYSNNNLNYEKKICINIPNKNSYFIKISDIHFEVDMEQLGCNAKLYWNEIYKHIYDIVSTRQNKVGIIVCKNFQTINSELLEIFYSYMQQLNNTIKIYYYIITDCVSFIPINIINRCKILSIPQPTKKSYNTLCKKHDCSTIKNIDILKNNIDYITEDKFTDNIIVSLEENNLVTLRENIYNLFIYHLNIHECLFILIKKLKPSKHVLDIFLSQLHINLRQYNNNYRPIYHLEKMILLLYNEP